MNDFNKKVHHPLQSYQWGEFRKKTGVKVIQGSDFQLTIHKIPHLPWNIGYLPKGNLPDKKLIEELRKIGKENRCIFVQLEPNISVLSSEVAEWTPRRCGLHPAIHPLFTKYTFILDLTKSEEELLKKMHPKTRYNIKVAQKHGVEVVEDNSDEAFEEYLKLTKKTTKRQGFYAHTEKYHRLMWDTLSQKSGTDILSAHLLLAKYKNEVLAAWILFVFKDTLYYPYGASSTQHRETMSSNLMMWEAIKFGKKLGLKKFDMWGALGPNPDKNDPWYGFHRFKEGYGAELVEFVGSYDIIINPLIYHFYKIADKIRWSFLRLKK
ncbi:MAG: peptidoglycan bridge formation glycyltransferase FemA/FemB family protein [Candidatus Levybacteria bacterium]|nr:peptidoglycan bridge formation glycyltransferase FemA/FemB family protein [Candidatus Levybacteria bacterium]